MRTFFDLQHNKFYSLQRSTILILFFISISLQGEEIKVVGNIYDETKQKGLPGANVFLIPENDSIIAYHTLTKADGSFSIKLPYVGDYFLTASYLGYKKGKTKITVNDLDPKLQVFHLGLSPSIYDIDEIQVVKNQDKIIVKEDTIVYSATNYKVNEDATVGDLIAKMPGISVEDDQVTAQNETVAKILVDGEEFFTGDPGIALNNLPADIVESVEVIDKKSEQAEFTGFDDGDTQKVINIRTKGGRINGKFGNMHAGASLQEKYDAGGNTHFFNGQRRLSIVGAANNINKQEFFGRDNMGMAGGNQANGISNIYSAGTNYNDKWGDKWKVNGNYFYNSNNTTEEKTTERTYYVTNEDINHYSGEQVSENKNQNHRLNMRIENQINSSNKLMIMPSLVLQQTETSSNNQNQSFSSDNSIVNKVDANNTSLGDGYSFSNQLLYWHKFSKTGRTISFNSDIKYSATKSDKINNSTTITSDDNTSTINQNQLENNNTQSISSKISYTEPLGSISMLMVSYEHKWDNTESLINTYSYDTIAQVYDEVISELTGNNQLISNQHALGLGYKLSWDKKLHVTISSAAKSINLIGWHQFEENNSLTKNYTVIEPRFELNFRKNRRNNIKINIDRNTQLPGLNNLLSIEDNSDPVNITAGNSELTPQVNNSVQLSWNLTNKAYDAFTNIRFDGKITEDYITNYVISAVDGSITYNDIQLDEGSTYTYPVNCNGYKSISLSLMHSMPITIIKSNVTGNLNSSYTETPGYLNDDYYFSTNENISAGLKLVSNISEKIDFTIGYNAGYNAITNTIQESVNETYYQGTANFQVYYQLLNKLVLTSDLSYTQYMGIDIASDYQHTLLNAALAYRCLKHNRGKITVSMHDILKSNTSSTRTSNINYIEDSVTNTLEPYVMLTFSYKFRDVTAAKS